MGKGATVVFTNPSVYISTSTNEFATSTGTTTAYDLAGWFRSAKLEVKVDEKEDTVFGNTAHSRVQGLEDVSLVCEAIQDFASTGIAAALGLDGLIYDLLKNKRKVNVCVRPLNAARTSDNPEYQAQVRVFSHSPVSGGIGEVLATTLNFMGAGNWTRLTSATSS